MILPHTMAIERLGTSGGNKETYSAKPSVSCFLQPLDERGADTGVGAIFSKASKAYTAYESDVRLKDRVTIEGQKYQVNGMRIYQFGSWPHKVVSLAQIDG